jgi:hypothetical protein
MGVRVGRLCALAIFLVFVGLVLPMVYAHWLETGTIVGLDMPFSLTALLFCVAGLLVFLVARQITKRATPQEEVVSQSAGDGYAPSRNLPLTPRFSLIPSFGLLYAVLLGAVLMPTFLIFLDANAPSVGIPVRLVRVGPLRTETTPFEVPVVVRMEESKR